MGDLNAGMEDMVNAFILLRRGISYEESNRSIVANKDRILSLCSNFEKKLDKLSTLLHIKQLSEYKVFQMQESLNAIKKELGGEKYESSSLTQMIVYYLSRIYDFLVEQSGRVSYTLPADILRSRYTETLDNILSRLEIITQNSVK
jgi:hypothetical protein